MLKYKSLSGIFRLRRTYVRRQKKTPFMGRGGVVYCAVNSPLQRCRSILSKFCDTYNPSPGFFQRQVIPVQEFQTHNTYDGPQRYRPTTLGGGVYCTSDYAEKTSHHTLYRQFLA